LLLLIITSLGPSLWMSALNVKYRDFRYVIPFIVQFGLYISPVGFNSSVVPEHWRVFYSLNPIVGIIDGFRWCLLGDQTPISLLEIAECVCVSGVILWLGINRFRRMEKTFADLI
jgi:lipopolysaccharide transport system permease protein